jgi:hypothetical protein
MRFDAFNRIAPFIVVISFVLTPTMSESQSCKCPKRPSGPGGGVQCAKDQIATCDASSGECNCTCDSVLAGKTKAEYEAQIFSKVLHTEVNPAELSSPRYHIPVESFRKSAQYKGEFTFDVKEQPLGNHLERGHVRVGVPEYVEKVLEGGGGTSFGPGASLQSCPSGICNSGDNKGSETLSTFTAPHIALECPSGNCATSIGQQGGITAGIVNIDTHSHLLLKDDQQAALADAMKPFAGRRALILTNGGSREQVEFGNRMQAALKVAGIQAEFHTGIAMSEGAEPTPWLFIGWGQHNSDMAQALVSVIRNARIIVPMAHVGTHYYEDGDKDGFQIVIGQPD